MVEGSKRCKVRTVIAPNCLSSPYYRNKAAPADLHSFLEPISEHLNSVISVSEKQINKITCVYDEISNESQTHGKWSADS